MLTQEDILALYQTNERMKHYVDHWSAKHNVSRTEVMNYEITKLYGKQLLEKEINHEEIEYEIRQDNGIT